MCGIVGIAGKLAYKDEATMKRLFLLDYFRGPDSTGFAGIRSNGDVKIAKLPSHPLDLFDMGRFKEALNGTMSTVFMGHNRAATRGVINQTNAHPFQYDHIVGMHNGTLEGGSTYDLEKALDEKFSVDSQAIIAGIARLGLEDTVKLCRGAWSLVWYDLKDGTLNFLRNKERPMWLAYTEDFDHLFWASEWQMIDAACKMGNVPYDLFQEETTNYKFWQTEIDVHYKFNIDELKAGSKERPKPLAKEVKGKEPLPVAMTGSADPFHRNGGSTASISSIRTNRSTRSTTARGGVSNSIIHLVGSQKDPFAGYISEAKFDELAKYGCSWCQGDVSFDDKGFVVIERDDILICPDCASGGGDGATKIIVKDFERLVPDKGTLTLV